MKLYGIIGKPLGHSFSKRYFTAKFAAEGVSDSRFENFQLDDIAELPAMIAANPDLQGFNVTIPYKQQVIAYLDHIDPEAAAVGAVNCVRVMRGSAGVELTGYNTDIKGFETALTSMIGTARPAALVLGTGGASKAVCFILKKLGIGFRLVSRSGELPYAEVTADMVAQHKLIINTTPLGTYPDTESAPDIAYEGIGAGHYIFDLVYNPALTQFLRRAMVRGATVKNGYSMLVEQAEAGYKIMRR